VGYHEQEDVAAFLRVAAPQEVLEAGAALQGGLPGEVAGHAESRVVIDQGTLPISISTWMQSESYATRFITATLLLPTIDHVIYIVHD